MLLKIGGFMLSAVALYYLTIAVKLKFFLSDVVFLRVPSTVTHESRTFVVRSGGTESVIREYRSDKGSGCAVFFPGQHGGIARYERELFGHAVKLGVTVYAISYPGYEGALGKATFGSVRAVTRSAIEYIDMQTPCDISQSVFWGRSLGSAIAVENALISKPKGLLLDSVSPSLGPVVREKMKSSKLLWPAQFLPIDRLLEFDVDLKKGFNMLAATPIVIFHGELDKIAKPEIIQEAVKGQSNIELIMLKEASHGNTISKAGEQYFDKLCKLVYCKT